MRDYMTMIYNLNPHLFKSPAEIRQIIDLREEQNTFVRIMETQDGKRTFIRDLKIWMQRHPKRKLQQPSKR